MQGRKSVKMDIHQLIRHYPGTVVRKAPFHPDRRMLYFYERPYYIGIPADTLSPGEEQLLHVLMDQESPPVYSGEAKYWYDFLIGGQSPAMTDHQGNIRIIQFHLAGTLTGRDQDQWREALEAFFAPVAEFIYLSAHDGLVIETKHFMEKESLRAIANTLENDFSVKAFFQIGLRYSPSPQLRDLYCEEKELFDQRLLHPGAREVTTVEHEFFTFLKPFVGKRAVLAEIRTRMTEDRGWRPIIRAIWENQGNLSMAAKHLFMHRNTLLNRIDKFYEITGISLKRMDGLTIAYLSTL
jgi:Regulator of polyketide synthase expression